MLGPVRFSHIETCTVEVCGVFKQQDELNDCVLMLSPLDAELAEQREEFNLLITSEGGERQQFKSPTYPEEWTIEDLEKAQRLVKARENAIKSMKTIIEQRKNQKP